MKLGFSVIFSKSNKEGFYIELLARMLKLGCKSVEINAFNFDFNSAERLEKTLKEFDFLSIHANHKLALSIKLGNKLRANIITVHPNLISQCHGEGERISFENMDWRKPYGKTISEMESVFRQVPGASFTCDLNHIFTNDPSMRLVEDFDRTFSNISHYHISGFKDEKTPHAPLFMTRQDIILKSIHKDKPVIIESYGGNDIINFETELNYINKIICRN